MQTKLLSLVLLLLCSLPQIAQADQTPSNLNVSDIFSKIPGLKQGIAYDINSRNAEYFTTVDVVSWKGFSLAAGYATSDKVVASIDYDLGGLQQLGLNVPLLSAIDLRVGMYVGLGNMSTASSSENGRNKFAYGPEVTIVNLKF